MQIEYGVCKYCYLLYYLPPNLSMRIKTSDFSHFIDFHTFSSANPNGKEKEL